MVMVLGAVGDSPIDWFNIIFHAMVAGGRVVAGWKSMKNILLTTASPTLKFSVIYGSALGVSVWDEIVVLPGHCLQTMILFLPRSENFSVTCPSVSTNLILNGHGPAWPTFKKYLKR